MRKEYHDWRKGRDDIWHFWQHFPEAPRYETICGKFVVYGLFDATSQIIPVKGEFCQECLRGTE